MAKKMVLIVAHQGYQPIEYGHTRKVLENAGVIVTVASDKAGVARACSSKIEEAAQYSTVSVDLVVQDIDPIVYDGIFIIGGPGAMEFLDNPVTYNVINKTAQGGKLLGAICISPRILAHAGLLVGKKATGWDGDHHVTAVFSEYGAEYVQESVVADGNIITADGPRAALDFGRAIVSALQKS